MADKTGKIEYTFKDFVAWAFMAMLTYFGWSMTSDIRRMALSIEQLNVNMAVVTTIQTFHDKRLNMLEKKTRRDK